MKRHHLFAFYCTFLVPVLALAGIGVGRAIGAPALLAVTGVILGFAGSYVLLRSTSAGENG